MFNSYKKNKISRNRFLLYVFNNLCHITDKSRSRFFNKRKYSQGLFNKAIAQSGNAFSPWSYVQNPIEHGFNLGKFLGFQGNDPEELVAFLKEIPADEIVTAVYNIQQNLKKVSSENNSYNQRIFRYILETSICKIGSYNPIL